MFHAYVYLIVSDTKNNRQAHRQTDTHTHMQTERQAKL